MIVFDHVSVVVPTPAGSRPILADVTAEVREHRVGVIGDNGSGKSTLLRLVNGLARPSSGRVMVEGFDTARELAAVRARVGFVFTDPLTQLLAPTPVEDLELGLRRVVRDKAGRRAAALARLTEWGLGELAHASVYDLSGGERQLVALLGVLAIEPTLIVADEPTTLLDWRQRRRFASVVAGLEQQMLLATHDLDLAAACERVLVLESGRVAYDGPGESAVAYYRGEASHA